MKCSNCQADNSKKSLYCSNCGLRITTTSRNRVRNDIAFFASLAFIFVTLSGFRGSVLYDYLSTLRQDRFYKHVDFLEKYPRSRYADHIRSDILRFFPTTYIPRNSFTGVKNYAHTYLADARPVEAMTEGELRFINLSFLSKKYKSIADLPSIQDQLVSSMLEIFEIEEFPPIDYFKLMTGYIRCSPSTVRNNPDLMDNLRSSIYRRISEIETVPASRLIEIETNHKYLRNLNVTTPELYNVLYYIVRNSIKTHNRNLYELIRINWKENRDLEQIDTLTMKFQARFQDEKVAVLDSIGGVVRVHLYSLKRAIAHQKYLEDDYNSLEKKVVEIEGEVMPLSFTVRSKLKSELGAPMYEAVTDYGDLIIIQTIATSFTTTGRARLYVKREPTKSFTYTDSYTGKPLDVYTEYIGDIETIMEEFYAAARAISIGEKELENYKLSYRSWKTSISSEIDKLLNL